MGNHAAMRTGDEAGRKASGSDPAGFTNTFDVCEFRSGGRWSFVMHGPDGRNYPNEKMIAEIDPPTMEPLGIGRRHLPVRPAG